MLGLVRVQPVKFFIEWPKVEGFKSLTPLGESEKKTLGRGSSNFQNRASSREKVPVFTSSKLEAVKLKVGNRTGSIHCVYLGLRGVVLRTHYTKRMKRDTLLKTYLTLRRKQFFLTFRGSWNTYFRIQPIGKAKPPYDKQVRKTIQ
jgi:hypothetical protein